MLAAEKRAGREAWRSRGTPLPDRDRSLRLLRLMWVAGGDDVLSYMLQISDGARPSSARRLWKARFGAIALTHDCALRRRGIEEPVRLEEERQGHAAVRRAGVVAAAGGRHT